MTKQITLEEALELVSFKHVTDCGWQILNVKGYVSGAVDGNVFGNIYGSVRGFIDGDVIGNVRGSVFGNVFGNVSGDVDGDVKGKINGRSWESVETPKEKLQRLLDGVSEEELLKLINQMENN